MRGGTIDHCKRVPPLDSAKKATRRVSNVSLSSMKLTNLSAGSSSSLYILYILFKFFRAINFFHLSQTARRNPSAGDYMSLSLFLCGNIAKADLFYFFLFKRFNVRFHIKYWDARRLILFIISSRRSTTVYQGKVSLRRVSLWCETLRAKMRKYEEKNSYVRM